MAGQAELENPKWFWWSSDDYASSITISPNTGMRPRIPRDGPKSAG
ncbi:hypothetical protein MGAST_05080 [Mycobacterium gastri 'Wayne']|nr:hypothetical protein MGAST_05080 [Mycobacterium gastri 'Wayne']